MGLRSGVVLRETEPGHCGIYLLTTAGGRGFVGRYFCGLAPCGSEGWASRWVSDLRGRSRDTAASTSSQPQAVMDSSADASAPRLLVACGLCRALRLGCSGVGLFLGHSGHSFLFS